MPVVLAPHFAAPHRTRAAVACAFVVLTLAGADDEPPVPIAGFQFRDGLHPWSKRMRDRLQAVSSRCKAMLIAGALFAWTAGAGAEPLVVIVNPACGVQGMTRNEVASVFMARQRTLVSGVTALPLDIGGNAPERQQFYAQLVGKTLPEVNAYWARLLFTGRASPPQQVSDSAEIVATVAANKGAIGYVPKSMVDSRVRVVLELAP